MGKFTVNAHQIGQVNNIEGDARVAGPVITNTQLASLTAKDREELILQLLDELQKHAARLEQAPEAISRDQLKEFGAETRAILKDAQASGKAGHKIDIQKILEKFSSSFGSVSNVLFNAVKLAQLFGLGS